MKVSLLLGYIFIQIPQASTNQDESWQDPVTCDSDRCSVVSLLQTSTLLQGKHRTITQQSSNDTIEPVQPAVIETITPSQQAATSAQTVSSAPAILPKIIAPSSASMTQSTNAAALSSIVVASGRDHILAIFMFSVTLIVALILSARIYVSGLPLPYEVMALVAEFIGTYVLVFTVCCCCVAGNSSWNATAIAAVLMAMIFATAPVSGGNLNPAVTLSLWLCGKMTWQTASRYCAVQVIAGIMASTSVSLAFTKVPLAVGPVAPFGWGYAALAEMIFTSMLCFVVLNCAASTNNSIEDGNQFFALAIGFVVIAGGYPCGQISGAHFNPAVSLGLSSGSAISLGLSWGSMGFAFIWVCCQCLGSFIAFALFKRVRTEVVRIDNIEYVWANKLPESCFAEFLGTFVLVLTVGLNIVTDSGATAWSAAAALMCMIYSLGDVSGAHFNPAVSVAIMASGRNKCSATKAFFYVGSQILGACLAGCLYACFHLVGPKSDTAFPLSAAANHTKLNASLGELLFTILLTYTVLATATTVPPESQRSRQNYFGLCIGACVMIGGTSLGNVSGGELNPAVSLGVATSNYVFGAVSRKYAAALTSDVLFFSLFEVLGGLIGAAIFRVVHAMEYQTKEAQMGSRLLGHNRLSEYSAEFLGTFYLVLTVGFVSLGGSATWNPLAIALVLMVMIYCTAPVSGGNLNPAVSLTLAFCRQLDPQVMANYCLVQICGGLIAGCTCCAMFGDGVAVQPGSGYLWYHAACAEVLYTTMLCFVVVQCAVSKGNNPLSDSNQFFALAIGFVIVAGGYAVGPISGACFNPAVTIGLSFSKCFLVAGATLSMFPLLWSVCQLVASAIAAGLFRKMRPQDAGGISEGEPSLEIKLLSEFLGVFILVITVGLNIITKSPATALSAAGALMSMIYALGYISGAHFNPAVTLAVVLSGRDICAPAVGVAYVFAQSLAAVFAGCLCNVFHASSPNKAVPFPLSPGQGYSLRDAGVAELFFTAVLAYTVLSVATVTQPMWKKTRQCFYFGLAIAACVIAGGFAIGSISGGELNPAVSLGITIANLGAEGLPCKIAIVNLLPFSLWELSGAAIAAIAFRLTHSSQYLATSVK